MTPPGPFQKANNAKDDFRRAFEANTHQYVGLKLVLRRWAPPCSPASFQLSGN